MDCWDRFFFDYPELEPPGREEAVKRALLRSQEKKEARGVPQAKGKREGLATVSDGIWYIFGVNRTPRPTHMTTTLIRTQFRSPLRYPGGKQRAAKRIADLFPNDKPLRIASPFFGGGSVELELASRGHTIVGSDFFAPVAAFWQQLKNNRDDLHSVVMEWGAEG